MNYYTIKKTDIANGPGTRVSLFVSGCTNNCEGCFNTVAKDFNVGKPFTDETIELLLNLCSKDWISGLSILGGDPAHKNNIQEVLRLCKKFKERFPSKTIWLWTGYLWEDVKNYFIDSGIDVVVDGPFIMKLRDLNLKYRGSSNQRVIDVKKSLENNTIVEKKLKTYCII